MADIALLGAGTWGIALARALTNNGNSVTVWSALENEIINLRKTHRHPNLDGMVLPDETGLVTDLSEAVRGRDIVVFAVPSPFVRNTAHRAAEFITHGQIIVDVAKGLEAGTHKTLTEVISDEITPAMKDGEKPRIVAFSGPTHAEEVALDMPTAIVAASEDKEAAEYVQQVFSSDFIRVYTNNDVRGIEISGALKNIIALAAGMSSGLGNGDNTKAALITRGMAEITRLGCRMGCSHRTFESLAGIGDLVVTCTSAHSRNNQAGFLIGKGMTASEAVKQVGMVVEGLNALPAAMELSKLYGVEMPICDAVDRIVNGGMPAKDALGLLMKRDLKPELCEIEACGTKDGANVCVYVDLTEPAEKLLSFLHNTAKKGGMLTLYYNAENDMSELFESLDFVGRAVRFTNKEDAEKAANEIGAVLLTQKSACTI